VGEAETPTVADRVRRIGRLAGWKGEVVPLASDKLPSHLRSPHESHQDLVVDTSRLRDELGFTDVHSVDDGLRRTVEWEQANSPTTGDPGFAEYATEDAALLA
jgi:nucleoside-diphosphate-sugar epimerase